MRKNSIFLLLALWVLAGCRNDHLHELQHQEAQSHPALVSKIISLNESTHKERLKRELRTAKQILNRKSSNTLGKMVNIGDSARIDTERVVYIENGPNYHTYTFAIERTNPLPGDPVENLVLTPLPDGTYKELLFSYNFTEQDKSLIRLYGSIDTSGKVSVTELENGTFNNGNLLNKTNVGSQCGWIEETIWEDCSSHEHGQWNVEEWGDCKATTLPRAYTVETYQCTWIYDDGDSQEGGGSSGTSPGSPGDNGGGGNSGSGSNNPPQQCIEIPTDPTDPSTGIGDDGGCVIGIPTLPNLPIDLDDPCRKIKANFADEKFKEKVTAIDKPSVYKSDGDTIPSDGE